MAFVGTRMHGYAVGTETLAVHGHTLHIGSILPARIAQSGYLVDIYA